MKILTKIKNGFNTCKTNIKENYGKYIAKTVAVGALGMVGYDAHVLGKLEADSYSKSRDAEACIKRATNANTLSSPSAINAKLENKILHLEEEQNWRNFVNAGVGYCKGGLTSLISNVIPLGFGLMTIIAGKKPLIKTGGWLLGIYGLFTLCKDVLGIGQPKDLNKRY